MINAEDSIYRNERQDIVLRPEKAAEDTEISLPSKLEIMTQEFFYVLFYRFRFAVDSIDFIADL